MIHISRNILKRKSYRNRFMNAPIFESSDMNMIIIMFNTFKNIYDFTKEEFVNIIKLKIKLLKQITTKV